MSKILRNAIRCRRCGDIIESEYVHEYVTCSCGRCSVDGGHAYVRVTFEDGYSDFDNLCIYTFPRADRVFLKSRSRSGVPCKAKTEAQHLLEEAIDKGWIDTRACEFLRYYFVSVGCRMRTLSHVQKTAFADICMQIDAARVLED